MDYQHVIWDFAQRTRQNLDYIEKAQNDGHDVFEITQLVISVLGLLLFPKERYFNSIPRKSLDMLKEDGWPDIKVVGDFESHKNLRELIRYLRNAIAHFNIEFISDPTYQLHGLRVWNCYKKGSPKTWEAEISFDELRTIVDKFTDLILQEVKKETR